MFDWSPTSYSILQFDRYYGHPMIATNSVQVKFCSSLKQATDEQGYKKNIFANCSFMFYHK